MRYKSGPGRQPSEMPTFVDISTGDGESFVGHEVMHIGDDGIALIENLDGRLESMSIEPEDFIVPE